METEALTTRQNATGCAAIMRAHGLGRALVVTQAFHRARAGGRVPTRRRRGRARSRFADAMGRWQMSVREVVARAVYRARGWI